jgi:hypothetical protein
LTPEQKIKHMLINVVAKQRGEPAPEVTADNVDELYESYDSDISDAEYEIREGEVETGLPCPWSRHYECKAVAALAPDGSWVGWTYWYGGGKHGEPEGIDWMSEAYDLVCEEEEKLVVVRTFSKVAE